MGSDRAVDTASTVKLPFACSCRRTYGRAIALRLDGDGPVTREGAVLSTAPCGPPICGEPRSPTGPIFAAELIGREALLEDGPWYSAPHGTGWAEIEAARIAIACVGLRRDDLRIALLGGHHPEPDRSLYAIGLTITEAERSALRGRLPTDATIAVDTDSALTFVDRFGFRWQCAGPGPDRRRRPR